MLQREVSAAIGLVGGLIDLFVGFWVLQQNSMVMESMMLSSASLIGYFLIVLGVVVLLTGGYLLASKTMHNRFTIGVLMILYGLVMLALGAGIIEQIFGAMMMQWSAVSGTVMILVGLAMLYSGYSMTTGSKEKMM